MTTYFHPQQVAASSLKENDKWMLFNILLEQFFLPENYLQYDNEKRIAAESSIL